MGVDAFCRIGKRTIPSKVQLGREQELLSFQSILTLVEDDLELFNKGKPAEEEL